MLGACHNCHMRNIGMPGMPFGKYQYTRYIHVQSTHMNTIISCNHTGWFTFCCTSIHDWILFVNLDVFLFFTIFQLCLCCMCRFKEKPGLRSGYHNPRRFCAQSLLVIIIIIIVVEIVHQNTREPINWVWCRVVQSKTWPWTLVTDMMSTGKISWKLKAYQHTSTITALCGGRS